MSTSRKNRKAYPLHPALSLSKDEDMNLECLVRSETNAEYYWRKQNQEVDFVLKNEKVIPIEVKIEADGVRIKIVPVSRFFILFVQRNNMRFLSMKNI